MYKGGKEKKSLKEGQQQLYIVSWLKSDKKPNQTDQQIQWLPLSTAARPSPAHHSFFFSRKELLDTHFSFFFPPCFIVIAVRTLRLR
jgi:hypothetical protein